MAKSNLILNLFLSTLVEGGEMALIDMLDGIKEHNEEGNPWLYEETVRAFHVAGKLGMRAAAKTKGKVDDKLALMLVQAAEASAAANGVEL
jgi:hypothetical protein